MVKVDVGGLAPATTYHYRLVARNAGGVASGADRKFRTKPQPLVLSLDAQPNPVRYGRGMILEGLLTGTGNAGRPVQLQASPFPHVAGFVNVGNPQVASAQGVFAFTLLSVGINTQFRVVLPSKPQVFSPVVGVGVARAWPLGSARGRSSRAPGCASRAPCVRRAGAPES